MIEKIKIKNFKCFDEIEIPFNQLTVLAGSNGSGKSTILQALLVVAQSFQNNKIDSINLMGNLINLGYSNDVLYEYCEDDSVIEISIVSNDQETQLCAEYKSEITQLPLNSQIHNTSSLSSLKNGLEYIAAERISPETIFSIFNDSSSVGVHGENVMNYLKEFGNKKIHEEICVEGVENTLNLQLNYWLSELFGSFSIRIEEIFKADTINLRFQERNFVDVSNERRPINVGFGITYILPILVSLLKAKPGELILMENPECHLHPKAQKILGELLARVSNIGVQIIVETHSDHILNGVRIAVKNGLLDYTKTQILFSSKEEVGGLFHTNLYSPNITKHGEIDIWPDGFFDEWDNALIELLK